MESDETALYRLYDGAGVLLYVGISGKWLRRLLQHSKGKTWWGDVVTITQETFPTRGEALAAEARAIKEESPVHNIIGRLTPQLPAPTKPGRPRPVTFEPTALRESDRELVAEMLGKLLPIHQGARAALREMDDPVAAFEAAENFSKVVLAIHNEHMTQMKARTAFQLWETQGLSLAELARQIGRSKARAASYVKLGSTVA